MIFKSYLVEQNINILNKNLILLFGENLGLKNEIKEKIKQATDNFEKLILTQEDLLNNNEILFNELVNVSLFDKKKIIFVENASDKILKVIEEIEDKITDQKVIFLSDILEKKSKVRNFFEKSKNAVAIACYKDNELSIRKIITNELSAFNGLNAQIINLIIENSNLDRVKLKNELNKIKIFFENKIINYNDLEKLLNIKTNEDFNLLKDEAFKGNKTKTNKLLSETVLEEEKNVIYINTLNKRLLLLLEVNKKNNINLLNAIENLRPPIFWKDKANFTEQAKKWNLKNIKKALNESYKIEKNIKSNPVNKNLIIKKFIIDICQLANSS